MIKVVAKGYIKMACYDEIMTLYKELVEETRKEDGCISYELCQDEKDPSILTMIETWATREALEAHFESEHFKRIVPMLGDYRAKEGELNIYNTLI